MGSALLLVTALSGCHRAPTIASLDDQAEGRKPEDFPELAEDVFQPMDGGIALAADETKGRIRGISGAEETSNFGSGWRGRVLVSSTC